MIRIHKVFMKVLAVILFVTLFWMLVGNRLIPIALYEMGDLILAVEKSQIAPASGSGTYFVSGGQYVSGGFNEGVEDFYDGYELEGGESLSFSFGDADVRVLASMILKPLELSQMRIEQALDEGLCQVIKQNSNYSITEIQCLAPDLDKVSYMINSDGKKTYMECTGSKGQYGISCLVYGKYRGVIYRISLTSLRVVNFLNIKKDIEQYIEVLNKRGEYYNSCFITSLCIAFNPYVHLK